MPFVISYFTSDDESMYLAFSRDGFEFVPLNDGQPVLRGEVGTGTLRDPFIGVGPDGRKIYSKDVDARAGHRSATNSTGIIER